MTRWSYGGVHCMSFLSAEYVRTSTLTFIYHIYINSCWSTTQQREYNFLPCGPAQGYCGVIYLEREATKGTGIKIELVKLWFSSDVSISVPLAIPWIPDASVIFLAK